MSISQETIDLLKRHEGLKMKEYIDTTGHPTIGYGRNLSAEGISEDEAALMLKNDLNKVEAELIKSIPIFSTLSQARQAALIDMAYNCGISGLMQFKTMLGHIYEGNFELAAQAMRESKWKDEVHGRCDDDAFLIEKG